MAKNSMDVYGAKGKTNVLLFDPDDLVIVKDEASAVFDERGLETPSEEMIANIDHYGVLQPIVVRKNPETGKTEVVAGRRRVLAAREANKRRRKRGEIPVQVPGTARRGMGDSEACAIMTIENAQREDERPMNQAKKMKRLLELGHSEEEIALIVGCSKSTVKNQLGLLDAPAAVRSAVDSGKLPASAAYKLQKLEPEEAKKTLDKILTHTNGSTAKRKKGVREAMGGAMRGKREIVKMREKYQPGEADAPSELHDAVANTLSWVLGERERIGVKL